jgi:hypothetical protein
MSNTIIYVFAAIAVILVVGFMYYFNNKSGSGPVNGTQNVSVDNYMKAMYGNKGGKRKRNKPRRRR